MPLLRQSVNVSFVIQFILTFGALFRLLRISMIFWLFCFYYGRSHLI